MEQFAGTKIAHGAEANIYTLNNGIYNIANYDSTKKYIIKIFEDVAQKDKIVNKFKIQNIAAEAGISPKAIEYSDRYITMEFVEGKLLQDIINDLAEKAGEEEEDGFYGEYVDDPEIDAVVIRGIYKLHQLQILHGDLHPMNIIIGLNKEVYFIDFSFSKYNKNFTKEYLDENDRFIQMC